MKKSIQEKAVQLRKDGYSYSYIQKVTLVSKSTLSNWLRATPYVPNPQTIRLIGKARAASSLAKNKIKQDSVSKALALAKKILGRCQNEIFSCSVLVFILAKDPSQLFK